MNQHRELMNRRVPITPPEVLARRSPFPGDWAELLLPSLRDRRRHGWFPTADGHYWWWWDSEWWLFIEVPCTPQIAFSLDGGGRGSMR